MLNHNSSYPKFYLFCITYFDFVHVLKDLFPQKIQCTTKLLFGGAIEVCFHTQWLIRWPTTVTSNSNYSHQIQFTHIKFKSLTSNSNRVSDWSAAKSMNTILSFHSLFHFTAILCDRYFQCMLSVYCVIHRSEISSEQNVLQ